MKRKRDWTDSYGDSMHRITHKRKKAVFWQWIQDSFEPEGFVNFWLAIYFGLILFWIIYSA